MVLGDLYGVHFIEMYSGGEPFFGLWKMSTSFEDYLPGYA